MLITKLDDYSDLSKISADLINEISEKVGESISRTVRMNQIRNVHTCIVKIRNDYQKMKQKKEEPEKVKIENEIKRELILLKPMLAYAKGRNPKIEDYQSFMKKAIDKTKDSPDFEQALKNFFALTEAVIAYHKYYNGND